MKTRMYCLTSLFVTIWLCQSLHSAYQTGTLFAWHTIVFSVCLLIVIGYCGYSAFQGFKNDRKSESRGAK